MKFHKRKKWSYALENLMYKNTMTFPLGKLRVFETAARLLSFTKAADELHLTQSAVSQQIKQLEGQLGFDVFLRLTRRLELTDLGLQLYESARRSLYDIDSTVESLKGDTKRGNVVVSVGSSFAVNWLIPNLSRFRDLNPDIEISIRASEEQPDREAHSDIDVAIGFGSHLKNTKMKIQQLGCDQVFVVASPKLLPRGRPLKKVEDFENYTLIHNEISDREAGVGDWENWLISQNKGGAIDVVEGPRYPRCDLAVQAATHGEGLVLAWDTMVSNELADKRLVKVFGGMFESSNSYYAWCTRQAYSKPKVQKVLQWLHSEHSKI